MRRNAKQSQFFRAAIGHTSAAAGWSEKSRCRISDLSPPLDTPPPHRGCQKKKNRHRPAPKTQARMPVLQGPSEVFRIVDDLAASNHKTLPRNRFLLHWNPFEPQWAVTPKLTMIAGQQLSIGALSVRKRPSRFNSSRGCQRGSLEKRLCI